MRYSAIDPAPPSVAFEFLGALVGVKVVDLVRYSWWPADEVAAKCNIDGEQAFALTAGPLVIVFEDGSALGLGSDPSMKSVMVWDEGRSTINHLALPWIRTVSCFLFMLKTISMWLLFGVK